MFTFFSFFLDLWQMVFWTLILIKKALSQSLITSLITSLIRNSCQLFFLRCFGEKIKRSNMWNMFSHHENENKSKMTKIKEIFFWKKVLSKLLSKVLSKKFLKSSNDDRNNYLITEGLSRIGQPTTKISK